MSSESDSHPVADTARELRQVRDAELPTEAENLDQETQRGIETVAGLVDDAAIGDLAPELKHLAQEVRVLGTDMTAAREDAFSTVAHAIGAEADNLDALLRPVDGESAPLPSPFPAPGVPSAPPAPAPKLTSTATEAQRLYLQRPREPKANQRPINQAAARFPPKLQQLARTQLSNRSSHAVQRHGHHLSPQHQLARLHWRLDPAFADHWELHDDGSITSQRWDSKPHLVDASAGTTPHPKPSPNP